MDAYLTASEYLGHRLVELGVSHVFVVPGDYNLPLLDGLALVPGLTLVNTANELNAGYAADGHARAQGLGCVVTTFLVGALSAINATAASFAEEVPVLSVVGVPNTSQYATSGTLHHTLGNMEDMGQEADCYKPVTVYQTILRSLSDARYLVDKALAKALGHRKPVLLEVCRDIALLPHPSFGARGAPLDPLPCPPRAFDPASVDAAAAAAAEWLAGKERPLIVVGRRARHYRPELLAFAEALGAAVTTTADAKGLFPEDHPQFIGTYFKAFSDPASISQTVAASDALIFAGVQFNEMSWGDVPDAATHARSLILYKSRAVLALTRAFAAVPASKLLPALAARAKPNAGALAHFRALPAAPPALPGGGGEFEAPPGAPLTTRQVYDTIQAQLLSSPGHDLVVDTGDSLWRTPRLKLPPGSAYETQCLAGNIGAGLPTGLGFSLGAAARGGNRTVIFIGDGGLQMTANDLGTFPRFGSNAIVVCINNDGYLIERVLSPFPNSSYNDLPRWDYTAVADAMCRNEAGRFASYRVTTQPEAAAAVAAAAADPGAFVFIEAVVARSDAAPGAGLVRRAFSAQFWAPIPHYQRRLAAELGRDFVSSSAGAAARRAPSGSVSDALAAAAAAAGAPARASLDGPAPPAAAAAAGAEAKAGAAAGAGSAVSRVPGLPTIDSTASVASMAGSPPGASPFANA
ncbi:pyruvate decarboxylase-like [Raphidocelis subcapitata]|uniref:pyruvate decarboxylase n=1 Tax=Raphidocelis subcapitata TaxID=307507 RepID=A0A2V0P1T3_9CHLO|nr:pyruvate decarboxylase-like [Raphidocelis subcapitata]|eukprot:GBF93529.1 pyruvate decarboxylase-like [Raphidocelis subcapitata]